MPNSAPVLRQSVRWGEEYTSRALNIKFAGIFKTGVYHGFDVKKSGPTSVLVDHGGDPYGRSVAVVERDGYSLTINMDDPGIVEIPAQGEWYICIEAFYAPTHQGYQRIVARATPESHHIVLAKATLELTEKDEPILTVSTEERMEPELDAKALRQIEEIRRETLAAITDIESIYGAHIELASNIIRLSTRVTELELAGTSGRTISQSLFPLFSPAGYRLGDATIAPVTLVPEGINAPAGAAFVVKMESLPINPNP